jgi:CHAT domain-containing protein/Tfp pilus assembly protein PilF
VKATLLRFRAGTFHTRHDWSAAQNYQKQAIQECQKLGPETLAMARSLTALGQILYLTGDLNASQMYHQQALGIRQKLAPGSFDVGRSLVWLGDVAHEQGDLTSAEKYALQALAIVEKLNPAGPEVAKVENTLGYVVSEKGDLANAEKWHLKALAIYQQLDPEGLDVGSTLNQLGIIKARGGDLEGADRYWSQSLTIIEKKNPDSLPYAWTLGNLGLNSERLGDLNKAQEYLEKDLAIEEKIAPDSLDTAKSLNNLSLLAIDRGDLARAEEYCRRSLAIKQRIGPDSLDVANGLGNLSRIAYMRGDLTRGVDYGHQALAIRERLAPDSVDMAASLDQLGNFAQDRGELRSAEDYHLRALAILEKKAPGSLELATSQVALGLIETERGNATGAAAHDQQALEIARKMAPEGQLMAEILHIFAASALQSKDLSKAEEYSRQEVAIRRKLAPESAGYAESLGTLAEVLREKQQTDEAANLFGEALEVLDRQLTHFGGSTEVRAEFRGIHAEYYSEYANLLVAQKKPEMALEVLERSRARTLLEMLASSHVDIRQGADPTLIEKEQLLQATLTAKTNRRISLLEGEHTAEQLSAVNGALDKVLSEYQELEGQIRTDSPKYAALTQPTPLRASEARQLLDAQTVLLDYSLGAKRSLVFVVTPTSLDSYELPAREDIEKAAHRAYDLLTSRNRRVEGETSEQRKTRLANDDAEYQKTSAKLSEMLLGPFTQKQEGKRLLIVADGALQYIPFAALPIPQSDSSQHFVPLVANHEIVNLPSASVLAFLRRQASERGAQPAKEVAILADPVFDKSDPRVGKALEHGSTESRKVPSELASRSAEQLTRSIQDVGSGTGQAGGGLPRLAFSRREAAAIAATTKAGTAMEALDFHASRETALSKDLSQYRILHFATHGLLDNEHPELSGLVFSLVDQEGKPKDGFVDLQDIYNLTIRADLVVLSACETGLGKVVSGEGLVGLTRGFMYAGANRVVASLWKVDDVATSELMAEFYKGMLQKSLPPAAALRQAQLEMRKQKRWADPYYWAAFTLQGEWK